jgi:hypothetical protein
MVVFAGQNGNDEEQEVFDMDEEIKSEKQYMVLILPKCPKDGLPREQTISVSYTRKVDASPKTVVGFKENDAPVSHGAHCN